MCNCGVVLKPARTWQCTKQLTDYAPRTSCPCNTLPPDGDALKAAARRVHEHGRAGRQLQRAVAQHAGSPKHQVHARHRGASGCMGTQVQALQLFLVVSVRYGKEGAPSAATTASPAACLSTAARWIWSLALSRAAGVTTTCHD